MSDEARVEVNAGVADAWVDPAGAAGLLRSTAEQVAIRIDAPLDGGAPPFGPAPTPPCRATVDRTRDVRVDGPAGAQTITVASVSATTRALAWGKLATPFTRGLAEVALVGTDGKRWVCAEVLANDEATAMARVAPFVAALADRLGVPAPDGVATHDVDASSAAQAAPLPGRYRYRIEADRWVLRDHGGAGPRASAGKYSTLTLVTGGLALATWIVFATQVVAHASISVLILSGALAAVLSIATFAIAEVARYARAYTANSTAVAWFADDRVVVAPWVARDGGIDVRPEGQVGAGMRVAEVRGVLRERHEGSIVLVLDTEHGPFELVRLTDEAQADAATRGIEEALAAVASPRQKKTALMRAREKRAPVGATEPGSVEPG